MHIFKNVLLSTRTHRRTIMNLFGKLKLELFLLQQYFTLPPHPCNWGKSKPTLAPDSSQAHPSYAQQFHSINFSNHLAHHISWPTAACKHQGVSHLNMNPLTQDTRKWGGGITEK